jgi:hypothetical protein
MIHISMTGKIGIDRQESWILKQIYLHRQQRQIPVTVLEWYCIMLASAKYWAVGYREETVALLFVRSIDLDYRYVIDSRRSFSFL